MTTDQLTVLAAWIDRVIDMDTACRTLGISRSELIALEHAAVAAGLELAKRHERREAATA